MPAKLKQLVDAVFLPVPPSYREYIVGIRHQRAIIMMLYVMTIYAAYYGLDVVVYPEHWREFGLMRLCVAALAAVGFVFFRKQPRASMLFGMGSFYLCVLSVEIMCVMTEGFGSRYIIGLIVCFVAGSTIELYEPRGLVLMVTSFLGWHFLLNGIFDQELLPGEIANAIFFIGGGGLLCILAGFMLEHQQRRIYLSQLELAHRNEALAAAQKQQQEFFGKITHELRTPVNAIIGFTELVKKSEPLSAAGARKTDLVLMSAKRLRGLISDILDVAKHEAAGLRVTVSAVDLRPIVTELKETAQVMIGKRPITVDFSCSVETPVKTDEARLRQILLNLTTNAVKYTMEGNIKLRAEIEGKTLRVSVEDTGLGIPKDKQASLFSAFMQARDSDQDSGTGLGLSLVSQFTTLLRGKVSFESTEGVGSRFAIEIPMNYEDQAV